MESEFETKFSELLAQFGYVSVATLQAATCTTYKAAKEAFEQVLD